MFEMTIADELGDNADLLMSTDKWLENHRIAIQTRMAELADELRALMTAQAIKRELQQRNLVPVRCVERIGSGAPITAIRILPLPDAVAIIDADKSNPELQQDSGQQERTWVSDGYDVRTARRLRKRQAG